MVSREHQTRSITLMMQTYPVGENVLGDLPLLDELVGRVCRRSVDAVVFAQYSADDRLLKPKNLVIIELRSI